MIGLGTPSRTLAVDTDNLITVTVANAATGAPITTAVVSMQLTDLAGANIAGQTFPEPLEYVATPGGDFASLQGVYQGILSSALQLIAGKRYRLVVTCQAAGELKTIVRRLTAQDPES